MAPQNGETALPLLGLRLLEIGHYIAAPFATRVLADLGAEVWKVEPPGGDPVRGWGAQKDGHSAWWSVHGRHKKCVTLNLKSPDAREVLARLTAKCDAVVENFRPGQLARLGFDDMFFREARPGIVICRISGYGQDGPDRDRASFGVIGEAVGGLRYLTDHAPGQSDLPPVRVGVSIGDAVAGLYAAIGVLAALRNKEGSEGTTIDVALTEAVLSLLEGTLPEYGLFGTIRQPMGGRIPTAAPSNAFRSRDGRWYLIAANSDPLFARLCKVMGHPEFADDPRFIDNRRRCANVDALEAAITAWSSHLSLDEIEEICVAADIPGCRVYDAADIARDAQYRAREMVQEVADPLLGNVLHPGPVPSFAGGTRRVRWAGPAVGAHNHEIYQDALGFGIAQLEAMRGGGVI